MEIVIPDGEEEIEDIQVGDWVIADDPTTPGEIEARQVLQTFVRQTDLVIDLYVDGEVISVTEEHPFWVPSLGWVEAEDLTVGMWLQTDEETFVDIDGIEVREGEFEVYNFEVEEFHTYFVSDLGLLVHNVSSGGGGWDDIPLEDLEELTGTTIQDPRARQIANGHAYNSHKTDFPQVQDRLKFAQEIEYIINNPTASKQLTNGRTAYLDEPNQIVVIVNPKDLDGGTTYRPRDLDTQQPTDAREHFDRLR
nr:polymorphic toxin-type HINT domain-containing protein [Oscillatoria salina]